MSSARRCSRTACSGTAVYTLTYVYADQTAVLGPLATYAEPHAYDLCAPHADRLSAPRGWDVLRLASGLSDPGPTTDDLLALADAVREAGRPPLSQQPVAEAAGGAGGGAEDEPGGSTREGVRRGHLRVLSSE